jgi:DNA-binding GntR family transcriptional regulator
MNALRAVRPTTSADHIATVLREAIADQTVTAGEPLRQDDLAERFGVSRMPVRDALRQLETQGLVTVHPTRGCFVTPMDTDELREIFQLREILEVEALRLSLTAAQATASAEAEHILRRIDVEHDESRLSGLNRDFHLVLYAGCGNARLLALIAEQHDACYRYVRVFMRDPDFGALSQEQHRRILGAVHRKDVRSAAAALRQHLRDGARKLAVQSLTG